MALGTHPRREPQPTLAETIRPGYVRKAIEWAILAPSSHNTQPWHFRVLQHQVELWADRSKGLPVADPHDRELTISCGAALFGLRVGFATQSVGTACNLLPDGPDGDRLASVRLGGRVDSRIGSFSSAMLGRHTHRRAFESRPIPSDVVAQLELAAQAEGARLSLVTSEDARHRLADLISEADQLQLSQASFRRELAMWLHANHSRDPQGMPGSAFGFNALMSMAAPYVLRTFDLGNGQAAKDRELANHSPLLAVLETDGDSPADWMRAGQALMRLLLVGAQHGLQASYLNQPIEVESLREHVRVVAGSGGTPQLIIRMGFAPSGRFTPRRPVEDVIEWLA